MPNNSSTQERSPSLTKSNLPKSRFLVHPWLVIVGSVVLSIAIASVAIISLTSTGRIAKDPSKQTTLTTQQVDSAGGNWWAIALLGAGMASAIVIFKGRHNLPIVFKQICLFACRHLTDDYLINKTLNKLPMMIN